MIEAKNITKTFKNGDSELIAVNKVSINIKKGDFIAIVGKSGSGKSTLLYQLSLLDYPTSGEIIFLGKDTSKLSQKERSLIRLKELGYVFQDYALMPTLTALDNIMLPIMMTGVNKHTAAQYASDQLKKVGLKGKENNLPSQLSGGEQQRVSIARAMSNQPKIIFADEPTANLDSETSELVLDLFIELNKKGQTIVMVTHETDYTKSAKKTIKLSDGKIVN